LTLIQQFLREPGWTETKLDALKTRYGITHRRHCAYPNLVLLKYNQIESPFGEPIVQECRGIILDEADHWRIVSRAFSKFFNHGEGHAAPIDWSTAKVQEKVDGSLCVLYWYRNEWHVATSGSPDASGQVQGSGISDASLRGSVDTFASYFWRTFHDCGLRLPSSTSRDRCFFFELTGPINRVVVVHDAPSLTLLGARRLTDQQEIDIERAADLLGGAPKVVREYPLQSFDDIARSFESISPLSQEGYVVVDHRFHRVKVKHPGYVALHHMKGGLSQKAFVEIARSGETSEVLSTFPEFAPTLEEAIRRFNGLVASVAADYERLAGIPEQKAFALEAVKTRCSAALFMVRARKAPSIADYFRTMQIDQLVKLLGVKDEPIATEAA